MAGKVQTQPAENLEESYPLSPMQQGMLFHNLYTPNAGVDVEQIVCTLPEAVNFAAFRKAWEVAVERHAILRTGFRWEGLKEPRQEVHRRVRLHLELKDWRGLPERDQEKRLDDCLDTERRRGFDLSLPPLMRLALFRAGETKYILIWTFHHLLVDGRAVVLLLNEVFNAYEALCAGRDPELKPPQPYRDYIEWLRHRDLSGAEAFWRRTLQGCTAPTPLPFSGPTGKVATQAAGHGVQEAVLPSALIDRLRSAAKENSLTLNTLFQGAWAVLLKRYSGAEDVVFGVVRACRRSAVEGAEGIVGLFINTLPVRTRPVSEMPVIDWLKELRTQHRAVRDYEHTPLTAIQGWSEVPRGLPLFESIFNFQDPSWDAALRAQGGKWANRQFAIRNQPGFPLWVDVYCGPEVRLKIGYDHNRFDDATIARMLGHFQTVLSGMATGLSQRIADLPLLTDAEKERLFVEWNKTQAEYPRDKCVHELFETQVERTPEAIALAYEKEELTYRELNIQANRVAHHLRSLGVGPDVPVGICTGRSAQMVVGLLGILKAGGAYVPLDPAYPTERLAFMLEDSGAPVLLTQTSLHDKFPLQISNCRVVCLDQPDHAACLTPHATDPHSALRTPHSGVAPRNLAYIIYTSGSTGTPKGVEIPHSGLVNLLTWHQRAYQVTPADRATQLAGFSFDASVWELWPYLTAGASVHIVDDGARASAGTLIEWLRSKGITISFLPTPLAEQALIHPWPKDIALRVLLTGGDKLHHRPGPDLPFGLVNHYRPTENTVVTTFAVVAPGEEDADASPPIGRPIANVQVYVLDREMHPVPMGVPGELCIAGDSLARGYRNDPALTAEKFVRHPFCQTPGARLYKTGDLVRWLPGGNLDFLGRLDHQVKIRGFRIEPGEIESALNRHPAVRESLVLAREDRNGPRQLVAYVIGRQKPPTARELIDALKTQVPDYMVPTAFVFLDAWPLTPNGKMDRRALPAPDPSLHESARTFVVPRNRVEETVAQVWSEVLDRRPIGIRDNFFELGGHSLLVAQVISRLNSAFNVSLSVRSLFEAPTVAEFARQIEKLMKKGPLPRPPAITRVARDAYRMTQPSSRARADLAKRS